MSQSEKPIGPSSAAGLARVVDAMRHHIVDCTADTSLREAARSMALHNVHALVVRDPADGSPAGLLSDTSLLAGLLDPSGADCRVGDVADHDPCTISSDATVVAAARLMRERGVSHVLVKDAQTGRVTGMLSTIDLAAILAGTRA